MNWNSLHAGSITQAEIRQYVGREDWQEVRRELKGKPLAERYRMLQAWLRRNNNSRAAKVQVTNYINALARGGMIPSIAKRKEGEGSVPEKGKVAKIDNDQNLVFGWAYVSIDKDGDQILDHSQEIVDPEDLEMAAYIFNLKFRDMGEMHEGDAVGKLVESVAITPDKLEAMGLEKDALPQGWWVGFYIPDDAVFEKVKSGEYDMFSIQGQAVREEVS